MKRRRSTARVRSPSRLFVPVEHGGDYTSLRGVPADEWIVSAVNCQRISSVWIEETVNHNGYFQFGYVVDWSNGDRAWHSEPTLFASWSKASAILARCRMWPTIHPATGQTDNFRASDVNGDFVWGGRWNGTEMQPGSQGITLDFTTGLGVINVERGADNDDGYSHFTNVDENHPGDGWTNFDDLDRKSNTNPDCHLSITEPNEGEVVHN